MRKSPKNEVHFVSKWEKWRTTDSAKWDRSQTTNQGPRRSTANNLCHLTERPSRNPSAYITSQYVLCSSNVDGSSQLTLVQHPKNSPLATTDSQPSILVAISKVTLYLLRSATSQESDHPFQPAVSGVTTSPRSPASSSLLTPKTTNVSPKPKPNSTPYSQWKT